MTCGVERIESSAAAAHCAAELSDGLYVQFGCGLTAPMGWVNFDASPTLRLQRIPIVGHIITTGRVRFPANVCYGNVVRGLPIATSACRGVYTSHTLEHLPRADFDVAIAETYRILCSGGIFRLVVPDLAALAARYVERVRRGEPDANDKFLRESHLGLDFRPKGVVAQFALAFGNSAHHWMWDEPSLIHALEEAGFVSVRRARFNDSADARFKEVEAQNRFGDAVAIEGVRP